MKEASRLAPLALLLLLAVAEEVEDGPGWLARNVANHDDLIVLPSGLQYRVLREGSPGGASPAATEQCEVHYEGRLTDGSIFDSSYARGRSSSFSPNRVIPGWTEALQLMRPGDKWELFVPPQLGYGARGSPPRIPPNAVLIFKVELISVGTASGFKILGLDLSQPSNLLVAVALGYLVIRLLFSSGGAKGPRISLQEASDESNPRVFFDMCIGDNKAGRIEMELFAKVGGDVPKASGECSQCQLNLCRSWSCLALDQMHIMHLDQMHIMRMHLDQMHIVRMHLIQGCICA